MYCWCRFDRTCVHEDVSFPVHFSGRNRPMGFRASGLGRFDYGLDESTSWWSQAHATFDQWLGVPKSELKLCPFGLGLLSARSCIRALSRKIAFGRHSDIAVQMGDGRQG